MSNNNTKSQYQRNPNTVQTNPQYQAMNQQPPPPQLPPNIQAATPQGWMPMPIQLQPHHWYQQQPSMVDNTHQQQQYTIPPQFMHPSMVQNRQFNMQQHFYSLQQHQQFSQGSIPLNSRPPPPPSLPPRPTYNNTSNKTSNNNNVKRSLPPQWAHNNNNNSTNLVPQLSLPPAKKQKKKNIVPPLEKLTQDAIVRQPQTIEEKKEVDAWKAERKLHWPSTENVKRKEAEAEARKARGDIDAEDRKRRLRDIIAQQHAMGLSKKAGTEDLYREVLRGNIPGRGDTRGRGRGRGRGNFQFIEGMKGNKRNDGTIHYNGSKRRMNTANTKNGGMDIYSTNIQQQKEVSLLEKLLSSEIRQDRSYLLQIFRFFIMNNFLKEYTTDGADLKFPSTASVEINDVGDANNISSSDKQRIVNEILTKQEGVDISLSEDDEEEEDAHSNGENKSDESSKSSSEDEESDNIVKE